MRKFIIFAGLMIVFALILVVYAFKIEPYQLTVKEVGLDHSPTNETDSVELKIVQVSDIHLAENFTIQNLAAVTEKINQQQADIVVFTGDLFDNYARYGVGLETEVKQQLAQIQATIGKYAVKGNHDYGGGAARVIDELLQEANFNLLENSGETLTLANGRQLFVGGLDDALLGNSDPEEMFSYQSQANFSLLLTHEPDVADALVTATPSLILAGHSHGGQIWLPFYQVKNQLAKTYSKGSYQLADNTQLYVNTGIGTTMIHARFLNPPQLSVFRLSI
ncbi:metallophosphoesterase [Enterococcus sp. LJL90]